MSGDIDWAKVPIDEWPKRPTCRCGKHFKGHFQGCRSVYDPSDRTSHRFLKKDGPCFIPWDDMTDAEKEAASS